MSTPFNWDAAASALEAWIRATADAPPVYWSMAALQRAPVFPAVVFEWTGPVVDHGNESQSLAAAPEPSPPVGAEFVATSAKEWGPLLTMRVVVDPSKVRGNGGPMPTMLRLITSLSADPVSLGLQQAGLGFQGIESIVAGAENNSPDYEPTATAVLKFQLREQVDTRVGYLTGATFTGTVDGHSFPITTP